MKSTTMYEFQVGRGGGLAFTTSPANGVLDVRLADGQLVAAYVSRADHAPHRAFVWREGGVPAGCVP